MCSALWRELLIGLVRGGLLLTAMCSGDAVAADGKERLFSEAPPKWTALEQYYSKLEVSFRAIVSSKPATLGPVYPDICYFDIRRNGDMMVSTQRRVGKFPDGKRMDSLGVNGVNSRYAFKLGKTTPDAESFILANFQPASDEMRRKVHSRGEHHFNIVFEVNSWDCIPLSKFIKDPLITITDVHDLRRGGRDMAQLSYERQWKIHDRSGTEHGTVILDPERYWCVCEHHSELPDILPVRKIDGFLEYGDDVDGFPILRRCQETTTYKDKTDSPLVIIYEFDKLVHRDIPESEFTLSAFGLPEVQVPGEQKPRTLWRWLVGIGIALGVLAVLLRVYVKKRRQQAPQRIRGSLGAP
jgi:hypothetical protein